MKKNEIDGKKLNEEELDQVSGGIQADMSNARKKVLSNPNL